MCLPKHRRTLILILLLFKFSIKFVDALSSYENRNLYKMKQDSTRTKSSDLIRHKHVLRSRTVSAVRDFHSIVNNSKLTASYKKWQVGRVSRKQYEIINMLWRKTKEFVEVSTNNYSSKQTLSLFLPHSRLKVTSTPSFIEFYYLDDTFLDFSGKTLKYPLLKEEKLRLMRHNYRLRSDRRDYPIFAFHIDDSNYVPLKVPIEHSQLNENVKRDFNQLTPFKSGLDNQFTLSKNTLPNTLQKPQVNYFATITFSEPRNFIDNETCVYTSLPELQQRVTDNMINNSNKSAPSDGSLSTIAYDKIKFFELYDKNTPLIYNGKNKLTILNDIDHVVNVNNNNLTLLHNPHSDIGTLGGKRTKAKHSKKRITESNKYNSRNMKIVSENINVIPIMWNHKINITHLEAPKSLTSTSNVSNEFQSAISRIAKWSENSFMATYIYEPSQVHCDAASISLHWLVTSGSCLSRRHKNPGSEGRSAFVTYCGSHWWAAERVTYVKHSVVHPSFHQRNSKRRLMYNIGLIQVVISMNTCPGWAPIALMSHRYITDSKGSLAHAVGWGLDRYDTRYSSADLPKFPLMKFESNVYSDSCPGNYGYLWAKHLYVEGGVKNMYCMLLPPYMGEATDPIHGSMLIIGGQLCAIYLQEERRLSGEQCAQYTGIWHLGPWVMSVAHEPDEAETFKIII